MGSEINWERSNYESRVDRLSDELHNFVFAVLVSIDEDAARASPQKWETVCRYFAGCANAARIQGKTPAGGGRQIAADLTVAFPCTAEGLNAGFEEFMDWLSSPETFRPTRLRALLEELSSIG